MKYIIFGGTFDPWTPAHEEIVRRLIAKYPKYQVVIVPTAVSWHRKGKEPLFSMYDRISIIETRVGMNHWNTGYCERLPVTINNIEARVSNAFPDLNRGFIDTLQALVADWTCGVSTCPEVKFVIGSDEWCIFPKWKDHEEILKIAKPIVVTRGDEATPEGVETLTIDGKFAYVSASKIRASYRSKFKKATKVLWTKYCADEDLWPPDAIPPIRMLTTPIFSVYSIPSDDSKFRPVQVRSHDWVCVIADATPEGSLEQVFKGVRQIRWGTGKVYDEFVTGVVDPGEKPIQAARRELKEELGIDAPIAAIKPLGSLATNPGFLNNSMHYFYVKLTAPGIKKTKQKLDPHEKLVPVDMTRDELFHHPSERPALMMAGLTMMASAISKGEIQ